MRNGVDADALIIGAGPAGASTAILLSLAGWRVILVEKCSFPRQKVCGECLSAASLALLDQLGVGGAVRHRAGPELTRVGWMNGRMNVTAQLPACTEGPYLYGRALGRDQLDTLLANRAIELGAQLIQPGRVRSVRGELGNFECEIELGIRDHVPGARLREWIVRRVPIVIDAHGSWEKGPDLGASRAAAAPRQRSDLFGFKASFIDASLSQGLVSVLSFGGGYGGLVIAEDRRLTLAGCIRRDTLAKWRARLPRQSAGISFERCLRESCNGVSEALAGARRSEPWLSIGPLRPQVRLKQEGGLFSVGNAAAETHPLIGEGMGMAIQSAFLLTGYLSNQSAGAIDSSQAFKIHQAYRADWQKSFSRRHRLAAIFAHAAMRPALSQPITKLWGRFPQALTVAARLAGKARKSMAQAPRFEAAL